MEIGIKKRKTALVFAGSSDIGRGIISALHNEGFDISFTWNTNHESAIDLCNDYPRTKDYKLDLSSEKEVEAFCENYACETYDLIAYCAGINNSSFCDELTPAYLDAIVKINFTSAAKFFNEVAKVAKRNKATPRKFIYISSVASTKVNVGNTLYGATKLAMERYLVGLASELARFNVKTLSICPGFVKTKMVDKYCNDKGIKLIELKKRIPTRELLNVSDVANVAVAFALGKINTTGTEINLGNGERFM